MVSLYIACYCKVHAKFEQVKELIMHTLLNLVQPHAVMCFVLALICLVGYGYPGYRERAQGGLFWLLWLIGGIMAVVAWVILVFS